MVSIIIRMKMTLRFSDLRKIEALARGSQSQFIG